MIGYVDDALALAKKKQESKRLGLSCINVQADISRIFMLKAPEAWAGPIGFSRNSIRFHCC